MIDAQTRDRLKALVQEFLDAWIAKQYEELRRIEEEGFSPSGVLAPFHDALVPGILVSASVASRLRLGIFTSGSHWLLASTPTPRRDVHST